MFLVTYKLIRLRLNVRVKDMYFFSLIKVHWFIPHGFWRLEVVEVSVRVVSRGSC